MPLPEYLTGPDVDQAVQELYDHLRNAKKGGEVIVVDLTERELIIVIALVLNLSERSNNKDERREAEDLALKFIKAQIGVRKGPTTATKKEGD